MVIQTWLTNLVHCKEEVESDLEMRKRTEASLQKVLLSGNLRTFFVPSGMRFDEVLPYELGKIPNKDLTPAEREQAEMEAFVPL